MSDLAATFSIVGRSADGLLGMAVSSCVLAVGAHCIFVRERQVAMACQAYLHPYLALDALGRLDAGEPLAAAVAGALAADPGREYRQLLAIRPEGPPVGHTGAEADPWAGHRLAADCAAGGNLLVGPQTVDAMVEAFEQAAGEPLAARLLAALAAAQATGGDRRGRQSAAVQVRASETAPLIDLRVDDHADPVAELARLYGKLSDDDLARARRTATTREPRPVEEIRARQEQVRARLIEQGR